MALARRDSDATPKRIPMFAERERQAKNLGNTLDRERFFCIAHQIRSPSHRFDRDPKPMRIDLGKLRDVIGNFACAQLWKQLPVYSVDDPL